MSALNKAQQAEPTVDATLRRIVALAGTYASIVANYPGNHKEIDRAYRAMCERMRSELSALAGQAAPAAVAGPSDEAILAAAPANDGPPSGYLPIPEDDRERRLFDCATRTYGGDVRANINLTLRQFAKQRPGGSFAAICDIIANEVLQLHRWPIANAPHEERAADASASGGAAPVADGDAEDAARWRETLMHVGAANHLGGQHFTLNTLRIVDQMFLLRGSVAQHFTMCIDASRASRAQAQQGGE